MNLLDPQVVEWKEIFHEMNFSQNFTFLHNLCTSLKLPEFKLSLKTEIENLLYLTTLLRFKWNNVHEGVCINAKVGIRTKELQLLSKHVDPSELTHRLYRDTR